MSAPTKIDARSRLFQLESHTSPMAGINISVKSNRMPSVAVCLGYDQSLGDVVRNKILMMIFRCEDAEPALREPLTNILFDILESMFLAGRDSDERKSLSQSVIAELCKETTRGDNNHLFWDKWLPWAKEVKYVGSADACLMASAAGFKGMVLREEQTKISWSIPSMAVVRYMTNYGMKITEVGAGRGYWTKILRQAGATVVAVDNGQEKCKRLVRDMIMTDAANYVKSGKANDTALFLCWPRQKAEGGAWVDTCLSSYAGDTIFYVGELDRGSTYEIDQWLETTGQPAGWRVVHKESLPAYPGIRDEFLHISRRTTTNV